jgi:hypothetical protein
MAQLGRISGPMLDADLLRNGSNLAIKNNAIDTPLLFLDVVNSRVGVNTSTPASNLEVVGGLKFTDLTLTDPADFGNLTISNGSISVVSGNLTIGSADSIILPGLQTDDYLFDGNRITGLQTDANIEILPNASGEIDLYSNVNISENMYVTGTLSLTGNIEIDGSISTLGDAASDTIDFNLEFQQNILVAINDTHSLGSVLSEWKNLFAFRFQTTDILIRDNIIETTLTNSNLNLQTTGRVLFEDVTATNNIISSDTQLELNSSSNIIDLDSTSSVVISKGTSAEFAPINGAIRYNTDNNFFEGYKGEVIRFSGIYSGDTQTSVLADPTQNFLSLTANSVTVGTINANASIFNRVEIDDTILDNNEISSAVTNANLELKPNGTGKVFFGSTFGFFEDTWINGTAGAVTINITDDGRVKFNSTSAISFPVGTTAERHPAPEEGMTRWNSELGYHELYNGVDWFPLTGTSQSATVESFEEIRFLWSLILT